MNNTIYDKKFMLRDAENNYKNCEYMYNLLEQTYKNIQKKHDSNVNIVELIESINFYKQKMDEWKDKMKLYK